MKALKFGLSLLALLYVQLAMADGCPNANRQSGSGRYASTNPPKEDHRAIVAPVQVAGVSQGAK